MSLSPSTRVAQYEILSPLGAGGMGEVYLARDVELGRDVAIKVLPEAFALDRDRLARIAREAQVLASLNHPHIAQVYGIVDTGVRGLVMEFVDGEDLSQRLARGRLPVPEALAIARQIADAIDGAHNKGIIHRDLKPANVKLTDDGVVKVLDFGLAKALDPTHSMSGAMPEIMNSPTITSPAGMTQLGVILGTAAYMAPEQARGKAVDRRADIWAFGVVLFEMLSGKGAFTGDTVTDVLAAIVTRDPDWRALPSDTPPGIVRLLHRCLDRDYRRRLADAGEARYQIEEALASPAGAPPDVPARPRRPRIVWLPWAIAATAVLACVALAWRGRPQPLVVTHLGLELAPGTTPATGLRPAVSISADGSTVVFVATRNNIDRLFVRRRDAFEPLELAGTDNASNPVISPDGRWVAFTTPAKLCKVPISGGPVLTLAAVSDPRGMSWDIEDTIVMAPDSLGGILRIPAAGGAPVVLTTPVPKVERTHRWPQLLAGGDVVLYTVGTFESPDRYDNAIIEARRLSTGEKINVLSGAAFARVIDGYLLFVQSTTLFAVPFDERTLKVTGERMAVVTDLGGDVTTGAAHFAVSRTGDLVYLSSADGSDRRPAWTDATGRITPIAFPPGSYVDPRVSRDGQNIAATLVTGTRDIWIHNLKRGSNTRFTFTGVNDTALWSRDGSYLYYVTTAADERSTSVYRRRSDGSRDAELIVTVPHRIFLMDMLPDEKTVLLDVFSRDTGRSQMSTLSLQKDGVIKRLVESSSDTFGARLSPNGRWIAYASFEPAGAELFVRPADDSGGRWQVSTAGGEEPNWSPDGRTLYFRRMTTLMSAQVEPASIFRTSSPAVALTGVVGLRRDSGFTYDIDATTGRFVIIRPADSVGATTNIRVIQRWTQQLHSTLGR